MGETPLTPQHRMYNVGVLGLTAQNTDLLDRILTFSKELYYRTSSSMRVRSPMMRCCGTGCPLTTCEDVVRHYYGSERRFYRAKISRLFPELSSEHFEHHLRDYPNLTGLSRRQVPHRIAARIKAYWRRQGAAFGFAYQAYLSALSCRGPADCPGLGTYRPSTCSSHIDPGPAPSGQGFQGIPYGEAERVGLGRPRAQGPLGDILGHPVLTSPPDLIGADGAEAPAIDIM